MIKSHLPLYPSNTQDSVKICGIKEKSIPISIKSTYPDALDCEEDIEVINMPITSFYSKEPFQPILSDVNSLTTWQLSDDSYMQSLKAKELEYMANPYYLQTMQPHITLNMRMILYDWMMEVCSELTLKRETFHLAINYCDRYLSRNYGVKKEEYQLIGLTCMYLAAKIEEVLPPTLTDWASSADNGYSTCLIIQMEKHLLKNIDFKIFPATPCNWTSWLMSQWDIFIDFHFGCVQGNNLKDLDQYADKRKVKSMFEERMILFKQANQRAYRRFRETMQILDVSLLHPGSIKFPPKYLACGLLYLMISKYFFESNYALLYYNGDSQESDYREKELDESVEADPFRLESTGTVQELYEDFIRAAVGIENIEEIYGSVSFYHPFLEFESSFELPVVCRTQSKSKLESHYEDFLAYQTHNVRNLDFVQSSLKTC
ncbi:hypothetical protein SteCoe_23775 [Stentor coeruleus]|uniref:Cyclin-like domain-containing protein n=1 Tax=Stentor coeruleus TaxID=5963 RepID=A0A1R2BJ01_9CILI|nr:hypothetical protein SteCoe_23775 [Stentor coeruleus]